MKRALFVASALVGTSAIIFACVGDDSVLSTTPEDTKDASSTSDSALVDVAIGADTSTPEDGGVDAGPRCDLAKGFETAVLLKGISGADDETGVWVSGDELTAYVAVTPAAGSGSVIKKATRASRTADFSVPVVDPQLAAINGGGFAATVPSMTSNGLVFFAARKKVAEEGMYVSIRASTALAFPVPSRAKSRANELSFGDPFIAPGAESLFMGRDNGTSFDLDEAPRDIKQTYGDGGFIDYAVAVGVVNVKSGTASDRRPVVSADRLTLVFASNRAPASGADFDLYIAQRAGPGGTFTSPLRIPEPVSSNAADLPGSLSDDGCALYFTSSRAGGFGASDVYVALRGK